MVLYDLDDFPSALYLIRSGSYRATCTGAVDGDRKARDYGPLDNFGGCEMLAQMGGRKCRVEVLGAGVLWLIPMNSVRVKLRVPPPLQVSGLLEFCATVKLFHSISKERLVQLCRGAVQRSLQPGEAVFSEDDPAREIYALRAGNLHTSQRGTDFSLSMQRPETFGESALFPEDDMRVRRSTVAAGADGATVVMFRVSAIETLIGYELQAASLALFNRKMLEVGREKPRAHWGARAVGSEWWDQTVA